MTTTATTQDSSTPTRKGTLSPGTRGRAAFELGREYEAGQHRPAGRLCVEGFYREDAEGRSMSFTTLRDPEKLRGQVRENNVYGAPDSNPVVIFTNPDGDEPHCDMGTVGVAMDDKYLVTIDRAIRLLEGVRAGLLEAGHADD